MLLRQLTGKAKQDHSLEKPPIGESTGLLPQSVFPEPIETNTQRFHTRRDGRPSKHDFDVLEAMG